MDEALVGGPGVADGGRSVLDRLKAERDRKAQGKAPVQVFDIYGYGEPSAMVVMYQWPAGGYQEALKAARHEFLSDEKDARLNGACDLLLACCGAVLGRKGGKLVDLRSDQPVAEDEVPESSLRFDSGLASALHIDVPDEVKNKGRFIVRSFFSPRGESLGVWDGDLALIAQSNSVFAWLGMKEQAADEELAGE